VASSAVLVQAIGIIMLIPSLSSYARKFPRPALEVAIFSRARSDCILRSLTLLERLGLPKDVINVFVAPAEKEAYVRALAGSGFAVVVGASGYTNQFHAAQQHYPTGAHVVI
jgi:hypothetical protein